jgi:catechol 2,3-dioxygenase-like lactoylglutathione lyase family enzyme
VLKFTTVTLNSPDPYALARFYAGLLSWPFNPVEEEPGWVVLRDPDGGVGLAFQLEEGYERPVWPSEAGKQQMQLHLEIRVDDLEATAEHAQACGAILAHYQPQDDVLVHLDPDGHPFCLWL